jgi:hypothetical protein
MKSIINEDRWIPANMTETNVDTTVKTEVFWDAESMTAMFFLGKARKPIYYVRYKSVESMEKTIIDWVLQVWNNHQSKIAAKQKRAEAQRSFNINDHFEVGDIVYNSWGYEQTNIQYYKVLEMTDHFIKVQELYLETVEGSEYSHGMADEVVPSTTFVEGSQPFRLKVKANSDGSAMICNPESFYYFSKWDGRPKYRSWYY